MNEAPVAYSPGLLLEPLCPTCWTRGERVIMFHFENKALKLHTRGHAYEFSGGQIRVECGRCHKASYHIKPEGI